MDNPNSMSSRDSQFKTKQKQCFFCMYIDYPRELPAEASESTADEFRECRTRFGLKSEWNISLRLLSINILKLVAYWCNQCILLPILDDKLVDQYILLLFSDDTLIGQYILLRLTDDILFGQYILLPTGQTYWSTNTYCYAYAMAYCSVF